MRRSLIIVPAVTFIWVVGGMLQLSVRSLSADDAPSREQQMLEQKVALVERVLYQSPLGKQAKKQPSPLSAEARLAWESACREFDQAVESMQKNDDKKAHGKLDTALFFYRRASAINRGADQQNEQLKTLLPKLKDRIKGYLTSLDAITQEKGISMSQWMDEHEIIETIAAAESLQKHGDNKGAVKLLKTLQTTMEHELVRLRTGETVISRMEFETAEDALDYELQRNASNAKLLELLLGKNSLSENNQRVVSQYLEQSDVARTKAKQFRAVGELKSALQSIESSTKLQIKALKFFGVNI